MTFIKRALSYCLTLIYITFVINAPIMAYAASGSEIVKVKNETLTTERALPFSTKLYVVKSSDTIAKLCKHYNISKVGFNKLNGARFSRSSNGKLVVGSTVVVPRKPLSNAISHQLDNNSYAATAMASHANTIFGGDIHNHGIRNGLFNIASSEVSSKLGSYLGQYGTVELSIAATDKFSFANSQFAMLLPLYDKGRSLLYTQFSYHRSDNKRSIGNFGLGARYFKNSYMIGANLFYDHDFSHHLNRFGLGAEYARDYLKASANAYLGKTTWHNNTGIADLSLERPADGWDVRLQGYLPQQPELGAKVMFEQYYGDNVALFGNDNLQKDPYAVTLGVNYTPVPLLDFNLDYKRGKDSQNQLYVGFNVNYRLGVPLADQLNADNVAKIRTLQGSRYDLVDRNNDMILEYKTGSRVILDAPKVITLSANPNYQSLLKATPDDGKYNIKYTKEEVQFDCFVTANEDLQGLSAKAKPSDPLVFAAGDSLLKGIDVDGKKAKVHVTIRSPNKAAAPSDGPYYSTITVATKSGRIAEAKIYILVVDRLDGADFTIPKNVIGENGRTTAKVSLLVKGDVLGKDVSKLELQATKVDGTKVDGLTLGNFTYNEKDKVYVAPIGATKAASYKISVTFDGKPILNGVSRTLTVTDNVVFPEYSNIGTDPTSSAAVGKKITVNFHVNNKAGKPILGLKNLTITAKDPSLFREPSAITEKGSLYTATFIAKKAGKTTFVVKQDGKQVIESKEFTVTDDVVFPKYSNIGTDPTSPAAVGKKITVNFHANNKAGKPILGLKNLTITAKDSSLFGEPSAITEKDGLYTVTFIAKKAGKTTFVVKQDGKPVKESEEFTVTEKSDPKAIDPDSSKIKPDTASVDISKAVTLTYSPVNKQGEKIPGIKDTLKFIPKTPDLFGASSAITEKDGVYTATFTAKKVGKSTFTVKQGDKTVSQVSDEITILDPKAIKFKSSHLTSSAKSIEVYDKLTFTYRPVNENGGAIKNLKDLTLVPSDEDAFTIPNKFTEKEGVYTIEITAKKTTAGCEFSVHQGNNIVSDKVKIEVKDPTPNGATKFEVKGTSEDKDHNPIVKRNIDATITVTLFKNNHPITGAKDTLTVDDEPKGVSTAKFKEETPGVYTDTTHSTFPGKYKLSLKYKGKDISGVSPKYIIVTD